jgi:UDP-N-acetyl-D-glucosamine dehydrogenase
MTSANPVNRLVASFLDRVAHRSAKVGVIGLGYVGVPLARAFIRAGFAVVGYDLHPAKIDRLRAGLSYLKHVPADDVAMMLASGFEATSDPARLADVDAVLICVPTPLTENQDPDLQWVTRAVQSCAEHLRPGQLIVLESTTYPGTTRQVVLPILEANGLRVGRDFFVAYSPEREDPGNAHFATERIPKVIGAIEPRSQAVAEVLYQAVFRQIVPVSSAEAAEATKLLENTYRAVNIALVNELKVVYGRMGIDVWEVIEAARTKPFGFQAFEPGPGFGGHCIPIDPFYLSWSARRCGTAARFIELAGEVNAAMPDHVVASIGDALNRRGKPLNGSQVALIGVAYKRNVEDCRESPGVTLLERLHEHGARTTFHDPFVPELTLGRGRTRRTFTGQPLTAEYLGQQDCIVIVTDHSGLDWSWIVDHSDLVVDTRNATRGVTSNRDRIVKD